MKSWKTLGVALVLVGAGAASAQVLQVRPNTTPPAAVQKYDPQAAEIAQLKGEVKLLEGIVQDLQNKQQNTSATAAEALKQNVDQTKALNGVRGDMDKLRSQFQDHRHFTRFAATDGDGKQHINWISSSAPTDYCTTSPDHPMASPYCKPAS